MLTDLIACTNSTDSTDTLTEKGTVKERRTGSRHNNNNNQSHSHSHSKSNKVRQSNSQNNSQSVHLGEEIGEELLLNAIAVCTNITFYACKVRTCLTLLKI
jgi:hypothetical protein